MKATATLFLDTRSTSLEKGTGMIKVNVYYNYNNRLYTTGLKAPVKEWKILQRGIDENGLSGKVKNEYVISMYESLYTKEDSHLIRAKKIIEELGNDFSFEAFKVFFNNPNARLEKPVYPNDLIIALTKRAEIFHSNDQTTSASNHTSAAKSLLRFIDSLSLVEKASFGLKNDTFPFYSLTKNFLQRYEKWMRLYGKKPQKKNGKPSGATDTCIGIYLRCVRTTFNEAIEEGVISRDLYPFSKKKYTIPASRNIKKALDDTDIQKILTYIPSDEYYEQRSWRLWVFSYLSNGLNMSDICRLKKSDANLHEKTIEFFRTKTSSTSKDGKTKIITHIFPEVEQTIRFFENYPNNSEYLFPFLSEAQTEVKRKLIIKQIVKITNKHMKRIAVKLAIRADVNTYVARHAFATTLMRNNTPVPLISSLLGHSKIATTENYLGSFKKSDVKEYLQALTTKDNK